MVGSKNLAILFLIGALLVGATLTYAADRVMGDRDCAQSRSRTALRGRLADDLSLSDAQRTQLDNILARRHADMDGVLAPVRPALDSIRYRARAEIVRMLDDKQQVAFQKILEREKKDESAHRGGPR
ncbi:MAG: hypothetical protein H7Z74_13335 [Anaerolineae bacterium]|nr:hypothetical protein [Gemmatimonadaceae bacterium]